MTELKPNPLVPRETLSATIVGKLWECFTLHGA
jgi:hypothetical protein